ncbi:MAG: hypothetical protein WDZ89_03400 [Gemmatimonadota bacterium]
MRSPRSLVPGAVGSVFLTGSALAAMMLAPLLLTPASASAQTIPSPYRFIDTRHEAGVFGGAVRPDRGAFGFGPGDGIVMGARYAIQLGGPFSLEAVASGMPSTRDVIDPTAAEGNRAIGEADVLLTSVEARAKFAFAGNRTWHRLSPHLILGGGGIFDVAGDQEADLALPLDQRFEFDASFLATLGAGVRWLPTDRLDVRAEWLLQLWRLNTPPGYAVLESELGPVEQSQWVQAPSLTLGVAIRF